jgi:hypothetical protein
VLYAGGIAAITAEQYQNLATLLTTPVATAYGNDENLPVIVPVVHAMGELSDTFKKLPGHEQNYVPRSEYFFKILQPGLEDLLFLGRSYEELFDRFEVFLALVYADLDPRDDGRIWGPPGRFAWKHRSRRPEAGPLTEVLEEATSHGADWPPLRAGLFGGSLERFQNLVQQYSALIGKFNWF